MGAIVLNLHAGSVKAACKKATFCFLALLLAGLTGCAALRDKQRMLVFRPTPGRPADFAGWRSSDMTLLAAVPGTPDHVQLWWLPAADPQAPTVLYLHGTFRNLYSNLPKIDAFREAGFSVVAVDYRGWGESSAIVPSEASIHADAEVAWAELVRRQPDAAKRVIYGHSMGGAVAISLASELHHRIDYGALIVESSFSRWPDVAAVHGWLGTVVSWLAVDEFDSLSKVGRIDAPMWILHGTLDDTVPISLGRRLRDAAPPGACFIEVPGGSHSRLYRDAPVLYQRVLRELRDGLAPFSSSIGSCFTP